MPMLFSQIVEGSCGLSLTQSDISISWGLNFTHVAVSVQVSRSNSDACDFLMGITKGNGASYAARRGITGSNTIRYQVYQDSALTKILKDGADVVSLDEVVAGGFQAGATPVNQTINYYFEIPYTLATTPALVSAGTYTDTFTLNLYEQSALPLGTVAATKSVNMTVTVPPMIALSLVDSGGSFVVGQLSKNIAFPTLQTGTSAAFDLRVRSNAGFSITYSSTNNGSLKHTNPAKPSLVPYNLVVNGVTLNMSNSSTVPVVGLTGSGSSTLAGLGYPMKIVIGSLSGSSVLAGPHADDVTITATTTE